MKIRLISDLHREFHRLRAATDTMPPAEADVIVLAGDIDEPTAAIAWAHRVFEQPVVYVAGNHEFYGGTIDDRLAEARAAAALTGGHVTFLERDAVQIGGWTFLGTTLWTDYLLKGEDRQWEAMTEARRLMSDHRVIGYAKRFWHPADALQTHDLSRDWLDRKLREGDPSRTVVVTHHGVSWESVAPQWKRDLLSCAFCSDMAAFIEHHQPAAWLHGHVHSSHDYLVGTTRVVCNSKGYGAENSWWSPDLVIDLPEPATRRALRVADLTEADLQALEAADYSASDAYDLDGIPDYLDLPPGASFDRQKLIDAMVARNPDLPGLREHLEGSTDDDLRFLYWTATREDDDDEHW